MKNIKSFLYTGLTVILMFSSCSKDFLDRKPYDSLPTAESITSESDMKTAVSGIYSGLKDVDLYGRTLPIFGDLLADNIYISSINSGRYVNEYSLTYGPSDAEVLGIWEGAYTVILRANNVIKADIPSSPVVDDLKGQAKAIRALMYFELIRHFAKPYMVAPVGPGVPLVFDFDYVNPDNPENFPGRNTSKEVYAQIIQDLKDGYATMNDLNDNSSYMNKWAAQGLLAKVYLYMGDWQDALDAAKDVVDNSPFFMMQHGDLLSYWANPVPRNDGMETLFEVSFDGVNNLSTDALAYLYDQSAYGDALSTTELYDDYSATDIRRDLIIDAVRGGDVHAVNKYPNTNNSSDKDDTKVLRFTEVKLILAEAYARTQHPVDALIQLNDVATDRDPDFVGYISTGDALINDILDERRKELAFEGDRYYDFYRLNLDITNRGVEFPTSARSFPASNFRRILPIPQSELDNNHNPGMTQNDNYPQ